MTKPLSVLVFAAVLLYPPCLSCQQPTVRRAYDVSGMLQPLPDRVLNRANVLRGPLTMPLAGTLGAEDTSVMPVVARFPSPLLTEKDLLQLMQAMCVPQETRGRNLFIHRQHLHLNAPETTHKDVQALLEILGQLYQTVELRVHELPKDAGVEDLPAVLDSAAVQRLLQAKPPASTHRRLLVAGLAHASSSGATKNVLYDWDVEVAEKSVLADPKIWPIFSCWEERPSTARVQGGCPCEPQSR